MTNKELPIRTVTIVLEDDFGRTMTAVETRLSPPMLMDKILGLKELGE